VPDVADATVPPHWAPPALLALSFVISLVDPVLGLWFLLLPFLMGPVDGLFGRLNRSGT
jgi:hypothetical protein